MLILSHLFYSYWAWVLDLFFSEEVGLYISELRSGSKSTNCKDNTYFLQERDWS
jgi:hypothetical protein